MRLAWESVRISAVRVAPVIASVAVLATGCSFTGTGASAAGSGPITVAVVPGIDTAPLSVAVQDGLFKQQGLTVVVKDYPSLSAEYHALTSGQAQVAVGDYTDFFYEQATGSVSLRLVADGYDAAANSLAILTVPGSGITTAQQLAGVSGGVATQSAELAPYSTAVPYNISTLAAEEVLQNDGVSPSSISWTPEPAQDILGALRSGRVKAILVGEPYIQEAEQQLGAVEVMDASTGVTSGLPLSGYFSTASYARANSGALQVFQQALDQAQADCAQRGQVQGVLSQLSGMSTGYAALVTLGTYPTTVNAGQVQRVATLMYDSGMINNPVNVTTVTSG